VTSTRQLSDAEALALPAGAEHYMAYVGRPDQYDLRGAAQFALLIALGLRSRHRLLDFGCGSLRAGRLLIPYLDAANYHGLEPNQWLVDDAIERQLGRDLIRLKRPSFHGFDDFRAERCGTGFHYIVAQSILSHAGVDIARTALAGFAQALTPDGLALVTFAHARPGLAPAETTAGWVYPKGVGYAPDAILQLIAEAGLCGRALPWRHPYQTWYAIARDAAAVPPATADPLLQGAVLGTPEWSAEAHP
jgi:cyclopropane fatty-acyl-phospholipid synthase-like methyltransferase